MTAKDLELIVLSALLHDIGYYPMAHDFEDINNPNHMENNYEGKRHEILGIDMIDNFSSLIRSDSNKKFYNKQT